MSLLGATQNPASFPVKKSQNESEALHGSDQEPVDTTVAAFSPILQQLIAAAQVGTAKKKPEASGVAVDTHGQSKTSGTRQGINSSAFIGGELFKMAGTVQGQNVPPTTLTQTAKGLGTACITQETEASGIGVAVNATATEGESGIFFAKDLGHSPSSIVNLQPESGIASAGLKVVSAVSTLQASAETNTEAGTNNAVVANPSITAQASELLQAMEKAEPNQALTVQQQKILESLPATQSATEAGLGQVKEPASESTVAAAGIAALQNEVRAATAELKSPMQSSVMVSVSPLSSKTSENAAQAVKSVIAEKISFAANTLKKSETVGEQLPIVLKAAIASVEIATTNAGIDTPPSPETSAPPQQVSSELLKLMQDKLGIMRNMLTKAPSKGGSATQATGKVDGSGKEKAVVPDAVESKSDLNGVDVAKLLLDSVATDLAGGKSGSDKNAQLPASVARENNSSKIAANDIKTLASVTAEKAGSVSSALAANAPHTADERGGIVGKGEEAPGVTRIAAAPSKVGTESGKHQAQGEEVDKENDQESLSPSEKREAKQADAPKIPSDMKSSATASATSLKEHAELQRAQPVPFATKAERTESTVAQQKQATIPADLLQTVPDQLAREISLKLMDKVSEMKVVLKPESLGEVSINVRMEEGSMVASIDVSHNQVRTALEASLPLLRDALTTRGIQVDRIDILTSSNSSSRESQSQARERGKGSSKRRGDVEGVEGYDSTRYLGYNTVEYLI